MQLMSASFWVRLHDFPLMARNECVGRLLGEKIGIMEEVDVDEGEIAWGELLRVQVNLLVSKPLLRGLKFSIGDGESIWVCFFYERHPNCCYWCCRLDIVIKSVIVSSILLIRLPRWFSRMACGFVWVVMVIEVQLANIEKKLLLHMVRLS